MLATAPPSGCIPCSAMKRAPIQSFLIAVPAFPERKDEMKCTPINNNKGDVDYSHLLRTNYVNLNI